MGNERGVPRTFLLVQRWRAGTKPGHRRETVAHVAGLHSCGADIGQRRELLRHLGGGLRQELNVATLHAQHDAGRGPARPTDRDGLVEHEGAKAKFAERRLRGRLDKVEVRQTDVRRTPFPVLFSSTGIR